MRYFRPDVIPKIFALTLCAALVLAQAGVYPPQKAQAAVALNTVVVGTFGDTTSISYNAGTGTGRVLVVVVATDDAVKKINSMTYGGVAMTQGSYKVSATSAAVQTFYLLAPASGANTLTFTASASDSYAYVVAYASGADTTAVGTIPTPVSGSGSTLSIGITPQASGSLLVGGFVDDSSSAVFFYPGSGTTEAGQDNTSVQAGMFYKTSSGTGAHTIDVDGDSSDDWAGVALEIKKASSVVVPTVTTSAASSLDGTSATLNGTITATGGANATVRGFAYGTTATLTGGSVSTSTESGSFSTGAFTYGASGLSAGTTYYSRSYATNSAGTGYGTIVSFTTPAKPTVTTTAASSITGSTATLNGNITSIGGGSPTVRGFAYGTTATLTGGSVSTSTESGSFSTGAFTYGASGLSAGTTYYSRSYATNVGGTGYGSIQSFVTVALPVVSLSAPTTDIYENGSPTSQSVITLSRTGSGSLQVFYSISSPPTYTTDYTVSGGTCTSVSNTSATIPSGSSCTIVITAVDDSTAENDEDAVLTLSSNAGYTLGAPSSAIVTIHSDDYQIGGLGYATITLYDNDTSVPGTISSTGGTGGTSLAISPSRVRKNMATSVTFTWRTTAMVSCGITGSNGTTPLATTGTIPGEGSALSSADNNVPHSFAASVNITGQVIYTLTCTDSSSGSQTLSGVVGIIPAYREI